MKALIFGATGMVGQAVLRECLLDPRVSRVCAVGRRSTAQTSKKLDEIVLPDVSDLSAVESELSGFDACMFCLGVSSAGMSEEKYSRLTFDLTLSVARVLARVNPGMTFIYVSGQGTDSSERGRIMWARVKGRTENALLRLPFRSAYMFRPGIIIPQHGITSRTRWTRTAYALTKPIHPAIRALLPNATTTTDQIGRAMIEVASNGHPGSILETRDINYV